MDLPLRPPRSFLQSYHGNSAKVFRKCFSIDLFRGSATVVLRASLCRAASGNKLRRRAQKSYAGAGLACVHASPSEDEPIPRAMRRTADEGRTPRVSRARRARSPRPFSSSAQLERVTYSRPSVGRGRLSVPVTVWDRLRRRSSSAAGKLFGQAER